MCLSKKINEKVPRRAVLGCLMFLACMLAYVIRTNLSIIIVAMVKANDGVDENYKGPECKSNALNATTNTSTILPDALDICFTDVHRIEENNENIQKCLENYGKRYNWNSHVQSLLLSGYFYGVLPTSIPSGIVAEKYGGTKVVAFALLVSGILNLLMPYAAELHYGVVFALRIFMGLVGAGIYPALQAMNARWVVPNEKGIFAWTMQGGPGGTLLTWSLCGYIIHNFGWETAFYTTSGLIFIFYLIWMYLAYDTPDVHPTITHKEKNFILQQIGSNITKQKKNLPIWSIATSAPFLVHLWAHFAHMWIIYLVATNGPKYTLEVLGFDMESGGFLTGLPYAANVIMGAFFAAIGDILRRKNVMTLTCMRKICMIFSHVIPALCIICLALATCNEVVAVAMMVLAMGFLGASCQTNLVNHQDLAPNFAGSLYGIMNTFGSCSGFIIPSIIGWLTQDHNGIAEWQIVFYISASVSFSAAVLYWIFGTAEIQPWNDLKNENEEQVLN